MNPAFGSYDYPGRGGSELRPNIEAALDRRWIADWQELRAIARQPRAPVDGIILLELRARWEARRRPVVVEAPPLGTVGPWRDRPQFGQPAQARHAIKRGREHIASLVYVRRDYRGWSAWWCEWRIDGLTAPKHMTAATEPEIKALVDGWLRAAGVRVG